MEDIILLKLEEMFSDVRKEIQLKHLLNVHGFKEQHHTKRPTPAFTNVNINRSALVGNASWSRRVSMPAQLSSMNNKHGLLPVNGDGRRSSLPIFPSEQAIQSSLQTEPQRYESTRSFRKFSRDSIDLDLVVEDADEARYISDNINSIIVEESEETLHKVIALLFVLY